MVAAAICTHIINMHWLGTHIACLHECHPVEGIPGDQRKYGRSSIILNLVADLEMACISGEEMKFDIFRNILCSGLTSTRWHVDLA